MREAKRAKTIKRQKLKKEEVKRLKSTKFCELLHLCDPSSDLILVETKYMDHMGL